MFEEATTNQPGDVAKNIVAIYSDTNSHGKHDASGAFIPEAEAFAQLHNIPQENLAGLRLPKIAKKKRRQQTMDIIAEAGKNKPLDAIALFGHGWPQGIQFGFNRQHIPELVECIAACSYGDVKVILFACLAAENDVRDRKVTGLGPATDGGFADMLRDEMVRQGLTRGWVDGHKTAGHTSWNPFLVRFWCEDVDDPEIGATGGAWLVAPRSQAWKKWIKALRDQSTGMRYRFPFMSEMEIKMELVGTPFSTENPY
jgi:hypothetical protein